MALLQALFAFISRSAGKILNAIFGWAVVALFGRSSPRQQMMLTVLVAAAALWPLLLVGVAIPKLAAMVLAFVPIPDSVPSWAIRLVWIGLALLVPLVLGTVVAARAPAGSPREPAVKRLLRGFPITLGIALAFLLMFVTVPILRVMSMLRGRKDEHVPQITSGPQYDEAATKIDLMIARHGLDARRREPTWWLAGPTKVLIKLGGKALRGFAPSDLAYWRGAKLEIALYTSDILVRGKEKETAFAHGLLAETFAAGPGLMTYNAAAQELEEQIHAVWAVYAEAPRAHRDTRMLRSRLDDIVLDLGKLQVGYDDWQIVYRKAVQLARALHGEPQLLDGTVASTKGEEMAKVPQITHGEELLVPSAAERPLASAKTTELIADMFKQSAELVKKEVELAKAEVKHDLKRELAMAKGVGVAAVAALLTLSTLLVAAVLALAQTMPGWAAALIVAGVMAAVAAIAFAVGWGKRVKVLLAKTQKTVKEDVRWAKERMA